MVYREIDKQRTPYDVLLRHESPIAAVVAVVAIIAQHKVRARRDDQLVAVRIAQKFCRPAWRNLAWDSRLARRKIIAVRVPPPTLENCVAGVLERRAID